MIRSLWVRAPAVPQCFVFEPDALFPVASLDPGVKWGAVWVYGASSNAGDAPNRLLFHNAK